MSQLSSFFCLKHKLSLCHSLSLLPKSQNQFYKGVQYKLSIFKQKKSIFRRHWFNRQRFQSSMKFSQKVDLKSSPWSLYVIKNSLHLPCILTQMEKEPIFMESRFSKTRRKAQEQSTSGWTILLNRQQYRCLDF